MVLVGSKVVSSTFVIILESDLFWINLGIPWLVSMDAVPPLVHQSLKFPHKSIVHVVQDTGYQPLVALGDFFLIIFCLL